MLISNRGENAAPIKTTRKTVWLFWIKMVAGALLLAGLLWKIDYENVFALLRQSSPGWLVAGWLWMLATFFTRSVVHKWICSVHTKIPQRRLFALTMISAFFSNFLPSQIGGDAIKGLYLIPYFSSRTQAYASLIVQRLFGLLGTAIITTVTLAYILRLAGETVWIWAALICALTFMVLPFVATPIVTRLTRSARLSSDYIPSIVKKAIAAIMIYGNSKPLVGGLLLASCFITIQGIVAVALAAKALGLEITMAQAAFTGTLTQLSAIAAVTPGGLGITETIYVLAGKASGLPSSEALSVGLIMRLYQITCGIMGGFIYLLTPLAAPANEV